MVAARIAATPHHPFWPVGPTETIDLEQALVVRVEKDGGEVDAVLVDDQIQIVVVTEGNAIGVDFAGRKCVLLGRAVVEVESLRGGRKTTPGNCGRWVLAPFGVARVSCTVGFAAAS